MTMSTLRKLAETRLRRAPLRKCAPPFAEREWLVHELEVHEIELELQNEELARSRDANEVARGRLASLFEDAPFAYVTLDRDGRLEQINAAAVAMFGAPPGELRGRSLAAFVASADADRIATHREQAMRWQTTSSCDADLRARDGRSWRVRVVLGPAREWGDGCLCAMMPLAEPVSASVAPSRGTVLLVDDDELLRAAVKRQLERLGFAVLDAGDGDDALARCADTEGRIDVIVSDVQLPRVTGPEIVGQLRERLGRVPVLFVSGDTGGALEGASLDGSTRFLAKPFERAELERELTTLLDGEGAPPSGRTTIASRRLAVLVVSGRADDHRQRLKAWLAARDVLVFTATGADEALAMVRSWRFDAAVIAADQRGGDLVERAQELQPAMRVVLARAAVDDVDGYEALVEALGHVRRERSM